MFQNKKTYTLALSFPNTNNHVHAKRIITFMKYVYFSFSFGTICNVRKCEANLKKNVENYF